MRKRRKVAADLDEISRLMDAAPLLDSLVSPDATRALHKQTGTALVPRPPRTTETSSCGGPAKSLPPSLGRPRLARTARPIRYPKNLRSHFVLHAHINRHP